jgi:fatty acid desaturase
MRSLSTITDPIFIKKELGTFDSFFMTFLKDERDLPFIHLIIKLSLLFIPAALVLFAIDNTTWLWWSIAIPYGIGLVVLTGPFTLMLHNTSHRPLFKREYKWGNRLIPWVLCPFMGQSPDTYFAHHIGMHHAENNLEGDLSSTMKYQRDNIFHFLHYYLHFLFLGVLQLIIYHKRSNKKKFMKKTMIGELAFLVLWIILLIFNWKATLWVFILPTIIVRFAMMSGNWAQHAFVDAKQPENCYLNSITCINTVYNQKCFNDGYHIGHHLKPHLHWTEMPADFEKNIDKYIKNKAVIFEGIDYFQIWVLLMARQYKTLAKHVVNIGNLYPSQDAIIKLLKERVKQF